MRKIHTESHQLLNNKKILIIGSGSTLAKELISILEKQNIQFQEINKKKINFLKLNASKKLYSYLNKKPDIVINFIGKFDLNKSSTCKILFLNIMPTWLIIKYYISRIVKKKTIIICIGSNSQNSPRGKYMLYAASKTALNNLVVSGNDLFYSSKLKIKIFNPRTFGGKHLKNFKKKKDIEPIEVAKKIYRYIKRI